MWFIALPKDHTPLGIEVSALFRVCAESDKNGVDVKFAADYWQECQPCSWKDYFERVISESACIFVVSPFLGRANYQILEKAIAAEIPLACLDQTGAWRSIESIERVKADGKGESWITYGQAILGDELEWA